MDKYRQANRASWDERAAIHSASQAYDIDGFVSDPDKISRVVSFDRDEVGDVYGKALLHLQCHIGTDTLSWARLGADVTGVDFSEASIDAARKLSADSGTPGRFEIAELYDTPDVINERFDVVYTGVGAICWLPDIRAWASVISKMLKPGGVFYIRDFHPAALSLDSERDDGPRLRNTVSYEWSHGTGETVIALIDAGLRIDFLHEHRFSEFQMLRSMTRAGDGWWRLPDDPDRVPLMFSIKASRLDGQ